MKQGDSQRALLEFKAYLAVHPENEMAKKMVSNIESGKAQCKGPYPAPIRIAKQGQRVIKARNHSFKRDAKVPPK